MKISVIQRIISRKLVENQIVNNMENEIKSFASLFASSSEISFLNFRTKRLNLKYKTNKFLTCDYDL